MSDNTNLTDLTDETGKHDKGSVSYESVATESLNNAEVAFPSEGTEGIQAAHDALPSTGGLIMLTEGTYQVNHGQDPYDVPPILVTKPNVWIVGQGWATEIFLPDNATSTDKGARIIHVGGDDGADYNGTNAYDGFGIMNLAINGNHQNNSDPANATDGHNIQIQGADFVVHNVKSYNAMGDGVEPISRSDPSTCRRGLISNCLFRDNWEQNIHLHGAWDTAVVGNVAEGEINKHCLTLMSHRTATKRCLIANNILRESQRSGAWLGGGVAGGNSDGFYAEHIFFTGNIVSDNAEVGVVTQADQSRNIHIQNNYIFSNGLHGVQHDGADHIWTVGNTIAENDDHGIYQLNNFNTSWSIIRRNTVLNNNRANGGSDGIQVLSQGNTVEEVHVEENEFVSTATPYHQRSVFFKENAAGTYANLTVKRNILRNAQGTTFTASIAGIDMRRNDGFATEDDFPSVVSGDGVTTDWVVGTHGLGYNPGAVNDFRVNVTPLSQDAIDAAPVTGYPVDTEPDGAFERIEISFTSAPASGTDNVRVRVGVEIDSVDGA